MHRPGAGQIYSCPESPDARAHLESCNHYLQSENIVKLLPARLPPGADLRAALELLIRDHDIASAFVLSGIGSLVNANLRYANATGETPLAGPLELLSISGTLTTTGAHLHVTVADGHGAVTGGHLGYHSVVRTTAELLLMPIEDWSLSRELDERTGFKELVIRPR